MKIGIFSDVHGYLEHLQRALQLFEQHHVDRLLCVGDLVDKGSHSNAVVELMQARQIPCVQGNHDANAPFKWFMYQDVLTDSTLQYLAALPHALEFEWEGTQVYMSHSNPWQDSSIYVYPSRHASLFEQIAESVTAPILIFGHTHMPMCIERAGKMILNPGALYGNVSTDSIYGKRELEQYTCVILTLPSRHFEVYDVVAFEKVTLD